MSFAGGSARLSVATANVPSRRVGPVTEQIGGDHLAPTRMVVTWVDGEEDLGEFVDVD